MVNGIGDGKNLAKEEWEKMTASKELANGSKVWYVDGKRHRTDGPAVERADGDKSWYVDGKRHRTDGPAIEWANGGKSWYVNNKRHRIDGPAIEYANGDKSWYVDGKKLTKEEWEKMTGIEVLWVRTPQPESKNSEETIMSKDKDLDNSMWDDIPKEIKEMAEKAG